MGNGELSLLDMIHDLQARIEHLEGHGSPRAGSGNGFDADTVDTFHASATSAANKLLALDADKDLHLDTGDISGATGLFSVALPTTSAGTLAITLRAPGSLVDSVGTFVNPEFQMRFAGYNADVPCFTLGFIDDDIFTTYRTVLGVDAVGVVASIRNATYGAHFEGWLAGDTSPLFRLQSMWDKPSAGQHVMQLEMGPGGSTVTDVALVRSAASTLSIRVGGTGSGWGVGSTEPATITATGIVTLGMDINSNTVRVRSSYTPGSGAAAGSAGQICWDASFLYICTAANTWRRVAHATW